MKKGLKRGLLLFIVLLIFSFSGTALAESFRKTIDVYFNDIKVAVNGEKVVLNDAAGNKVEPFIYNGTTYLPVRAVANALGQKVSWDDNSKTVIIGETPGTIGKWIDEIKPFSQDFQVMQNWESIHKDTIGKTYEHGTKFSTQLIGNTNLFEPADSSYANYLLEGKYKTFNGKLTIFNVTEYSGHECDTVVKIYLDDELAYKSPLLTKDSLPVEFSIDVSNVEVMKIVYDFQPPEKYGIINSNIAIVDAGFYY